MEEIRLERIEGDYMKDNDQSIYFGKEKILSTDFKTFKIIEHTDARCAKDKNRVYFGKNIIKEADPETFEVIGEGILGEITYLKDKNRIYYYFSDFKVTKVLEGADLESFELLNGGDTYAIDKNHVYFYCNLDGRIDRNTFEFLDDAFIKDKYGVYCNGAYMEGVDLKTFTILFDNESNPEYRCISPYSRDKENAFFESHIIKGADIETFSNYVNGYATDKNHVYRYGSIIIGADPKTFQTVDLECYPDGEDSHYDEWGWDPIYTMDEKHVFYGENSIVPFQIRPLTVGSRKS